MESCEKKALIECAHQRLPEMSRNYKQFGRPVVSTVSAQVVSTSSTTGEKVAELLEPVERKADTEPVEVPAGGEVKE